MAERQATRETRAQMDTAALAEAAKLMDQEFDRVCRVYDAAKLLRERVGATVQEVLDECQALEERKVILQAEVDTLEAQLAALKAPAPASTTRARSTA